MYARIYNKSLEVSKKKTNSWFYDIWMANNMNVSNVWNIEFELVRGFFKEYGIDTVEKTLNYFIKPIWEYCTKEWLVLTNKDNSRIERASINSLWINLQSKFKDYESRSLIKREQQLNATAEALIPSTIGNITSLGARLNKDNIDDVMSYIRLAGSEYLKNARNSNYMKEIIEKKSILKGC